MFKARIIEAYGTGAMGGHRFFSCNGVAMHRSPKRAMELAQEQVDRQEGREWVPIYRGVAIIKGGELIYEELG